LGAEGGMAGGNQMGLGARPKTGVLRPHHAEEVSSETDVGISFPLASTKDKRKGNYILFAPNIKIIFKNSKQHHSYLNKNN